MSEQNPTHARFEAKEPVVDEETITFELGDQTFTCLSRTSMPAGALRRLSQGTWTTESTCAFIEGVLVDKDDPKDETPTQIERFRRTLDRKDMVVDIELISDLVVWLIGAVSARPTASPSGLTSGQKRTRATSKVKPGGEESTSVA